MNHHEPQQPSALAARPKNKFQLGIGTVIAVVVIVALSSFIVGSRAQGWITTWNNRNAAVTPEALDYASLQEVYALLREKYDGKLDEQKLIDGAKRGLVEAAGDPYSVYLTRDEAAEYANELEGKFSGVGAELGKKDGKLFIVSTLDDSPAKKSGLLNGDVLVAVNDQQTTDWSIDKAVSEIRGPKGTSVKLSVLRNNELKDISIVRDEIVNPSVKAEITADNIGILRISRFDEKASSLAETAARDFKAKGVKGVVLDLRGNGGGYLDVSQQVAGLWLRDKVVVIEKKGERVTETLRSSGSAPLEGVPTIVLINGGSASASEIVAGALHDHKAAQLVGEKSYGKGSVQAILDVPDGGQLKVTIAKWFTPNGKNLSKEGIEPDIKVEPSDADVAANRDVQREKALELLKK